jgi:hypothetical protein
LSTAGDREIISAGLWRRQRMDEQVHKYRLAAVG